MEFEDGLEFNIQDDGSTRILFSGVLIATMSKPNEAGKVFLRLLDRHSNLLREWMVNYPVYNYDDSAKHITSLLEEHVNKNWDDIL